MWTGHKATRAASSAGNSHKDPRVCQERSSSASSVKRHARTQHHWSNSWGTCNRFYTIMHTPEPSSVAPLNTHSLIPSFVGIKIRIHCESPIHWRWRDLACQVTKLYSCFHSLIATCSHCLLHIFGLLLNNFTILLNKKLDNYKSNKNNNVVSSHFSSFHLAIQWFGYFSFCIILGHFGSFSENKQRN